MSKDDFLESNIKNSCQGTGNHSSGCFIKSSQVDLTNDFLKITFSFFTEVRGKIRIDVYRVIPLKVLETIKFERGNKNYSKIVRIDLR